MTTKLHSTRTAIDEAEAAMLRTKVEDAARGAVNEAGAGDARADLVAQTSAVLDEARRSIGRAERCLYTLWQRTLRVGDDHLATELTEASHLLRAAHRDLARRVARVDGGRAVQESPGRPLIGTTELGAPIGSEDSTRRPIPGDVHLDREGDRIVLWLWGDHDHSNLDRLNERLVECAELRGTTVVADLRNTTFIDGSTIGAFARASALLRAHRKSLRLRWPSTHQHRMLEAAGLQDLITRETPRSPTATDRIGS